MKCYCQHSKLCKITEPTMAQKLKHFQIFYHVLLVCRYLRQLIQQKLYRCMDFFLKKKNLHI